MSKHSLNKIRAIISVDLEDWDTSAYLRSYVKEDDICPKIKEATYPILNLFEKKSITATFFVLGIIAEKNPDLIKEISLKGHEIASHGYSHTPLWHLTEKSFKDELKKTSLIIEDITGKKPSGFRAPYVSLNKKTSWAIDILQQEGFIYDSSIFPMRTPLYGVKNAPDETYRISSRNICQDDPESQIVEVPFTVFNFCKVKIPCAGGFYSRVIPVVFLKYFFKKMNKDQPINFYFHPWETFSDIPRIKVPLFNRFVSYYNTNKYLKKIEQLIDSFEFVSFKEHVEMFMGRIKDPIK